MFDVHIIVLNWNGREDSLDCLESIERIAYPELSVTIVDNGSKDGSVEAIRPSYPRVNIIENKKNLGFAEGNNVGIRYALQRGADYFLVLNNDTVVDENIIDAFVEAAKKEPGAGIFGGKIYFYDEPEKIWYAGGKWDSRKGHCRHVGWGEIDDGEGHNGVAEVDCVSGCAMFVSKAVAERVGLFSPDYYLTFEDTDWCYRAKREGFRSLYVPRAKVWHKVSATFGGKTPLYTYYFERNRLLWAKRNLAVPERLDVYREVVKELFRFVRHIHHPTVILNFHAKIAGICDHLLGRYGEAPRSLRCRLCAPQAIEK